MSWLVGSVLSIDPTLIGQLGSTMSVEDCYDLLEVSLVNSHNKAALQKHARRNP